MNGDQVVAQYVLPRTGSATVGEKAWELPCICVGRHVAVERALRPDLEPTCHADKREVAMGQGDVLRATVNVSWGIPAGSEPQAARPILGDPWQFLAVFGLHEVEIHWKFRTTARKPASGESRRPVGHGDFAETCTESLQSFRDVVAMLRERNGGSRRPVLDFESLQRQFPGLQNGGAENGEG
jgi:hypothetical protein